MNFRDRKSKRDESPPDLTPLIDVVFLLLIFFLVTAAFTDDDRSTLPIDLPEAATGEGAPQDEMITLTLRDDGRVLLRVDGADIDEELERTELRSRMAEIHEEFPDVPLFLRGDRDASYGRYIETIDVLRDVGFRRVNSVVDVPR